jgi:ribonuclease T2
MGKEGLMAVAQHKRLVALTPAAGHLRLERFMRSNVSRLLRTDLLAVLAELLMKVYPLPSQKKAVCSTIFFVHD